MRIIKTSNSSRDILIDDFNYDRLYALSKVISFCDNYRSGISLSVNLGTTWSTPLTKIIILTDAPIIDHKDRNYFNCQISNLRPCSYTQNCLNKKPRKFGSSIYVGVSWMRSYQMWEGYVSYRYKRYRAGYFKTELEAAKARDILAVKLHGEFAYLNFPNEKES